MAHNFQLAKGIEISDISRVQEAYCITKEKDYFLLRINVSGEKIENMFLELSKKVKQPAFFILETPTNKEIEERLRKTPQDDFHKDVFYLNSLNYNGLQIFFNKYKETLIHNGGISFGYSSYSTGGQVMDEVYVGSYKIFHIYTNEPHKYEFLLKKHDYAKKDKLITLRDVINRDNQGTRIISLPGALQPYKLIEELEKEGLEFAERRTDA